MAAREAVILIVDDEPSSRWALAHVLRRLRARCLEAADGRAALEALERQAVSLVVLDAKLPDGDGLELARRVHRSSPGVPILLVSGYFYRDSPLVQAALAEGAIGGFLAKPFVHAELLRAAESALGGG